VPRRAESTVRRERGHHRPGGHRFADADDIERIYDRAVMLKLAAEASARLPEPSANPAVVHEDPGAAASRPLAHKLRRAWDCISGNH
jgi:hypothetical protein